MADTIDDHRRRIIEPTERAVRQPDCGCLARWQWQYRTAKAVLPDSVTVTGIAPCDRHANDADYLTTLAAAIRQRLIDLRDKSSALDALLDDRD